MIMPYLYYIISLIIIIISSYYLTAYSIIQTLLISGITFICLGFIAIDERKKRQLYKILDSSILIDGRIVNLSKTGFLEGLLIIPDFVISELELIAGSSDELKKSRGKRGLNIVETLKRLKKITISISSTTYPKSLSVEEKLLKMCREKNAVLLSNDLKLNKIGTLKGLVVLNINELGNTMKPAIISGETLLIKIMKEGKEQGQGIGYLNDGTMVVVENGQKEMNNQVTVIATSVLQTAAGRMIFAKLQ